jgi:membrane protein YqaA with SNARE-associated domain
MSGWLLATLGTAALGSVLPVVNIELYLVGTLTAVDGPVWWALALAATFGQLAGKTLFYFAGRGSFTLGARLERMTEAKSGSRRAAWLEKYHDLSASHPWWGLSVLFVGAITGLPPFTVMCFLSGAAGVPFLGWLAVSVTGRGIHFLLVAGAPELIRHLPAAFG